MANRRGKSGSSHRVFLKITVEGECGHEIKRRFLLGRKAMTSVDCIEKQKYHFADKGPYNQSYGFSSSCVWMWELDHEEGWLPKNWCFWTVVLKKTLESPLECKEIKPVSPKGNKPWIFFGRTGAEADVPILWPPDVKSRFVGKDPDPGKDWKQKKGSAEDEIVRWHHWVKGHEFEQIPGDSGGRRRLACYSP